MKGLKKLFRRKKKPTTDSDKRPSAQSTPQPISTPVVNSQPSNPIAADVPSEVAPSRQQDPITRVSASTERAEGRVRHPQATRMTDEVRKGPVPSSAPNGDGKSAPESVKAKSNVTSINSEDGVGAQATKVRHKGVSDTFKGLVATEPFGGKDGPTNSVDHHNVLNLGDAYDAIPLIEQVKLPRGGISMETKAVGRVQVRDESFDFENSRCLVTGVFPVYYCNFNHSCALPFSAVWHPT